MNRKLKKLNLKHEYLLLEEEDVRLELHSYVSDFERRFDKYYNNPKSKSSSETQDYIWVNQETGETSTTPPSDEDTNSESKKSKDKRLESKSKKVDSVKMKKLFKKLAAIIHPDRGGSDEEFHKLNQAYDDGDLITLLNYAKKYDIEYEMDKSDSEIFEKNLNKIESEISRMKGTLAWLWGTGNLKSRMDVIKTVQRQTGWEIDESDLPEEMRTNNKETKLLK